MALIDSFGRCIKYLRISVTDRCNLRCQYCMPPEGVAKLNHNEVLSYESLHRIAGAAVALGVEKIRLTGGEPLIRKGIVPFVDRIAALPGLKELALTTNGLLLCDLAIQLRRAGLHRLNVSLDSLNAETFANITRGGSLTAVLDGLAAAEDAGFPSPKINVVVMRGINDGELLDFAAFAIARRCTVRFIEYMPTRGSQDWCAKAVTGAEILHIIGQAYSLVNVDAHKHSKPSRDFRIEGTDATIGIISPVSNHFCQACDRIRLTASGIAKACLFGTAGVDMKPYLSRSDNDLREVLRQIVASKPDRHRLSATSQPNAWVAMSQIGG